MIFMKNPEKGQVKTRLAKDMGEDKALNVYCDLLKHTRNVVREVECDRQLYYSNHIDSNDGWSNHEFEKRLQQGENLGERMQNAFTEAFLQAYEKVVIIGSDCISLSSPVIQKAFEALGTQEVVIGPATDGGYYLLGMRNLLPQLFRDINWSSSEVLNQTLRTVTILNMEATLLPLLSDVDTLDDYIAHKHLFV
ncbi:MAG: TIGR04282 family arsenosugar biosynthesis glycosyltransferase [Bacteroidia bacterium]